MTSESELSESETLAAYPVRHTKYFSTRTIQAENLRLETTFSDIFNGFKDHGEIEGISLERRYDSKSVYVSFVRNEDYEQIIKISSVQINGENVDFSPFKVSETPEHNDGLKASTLNEAKVLSVRSGPNTKPTNTEAISGKEPPKTTQKASASKPAAKTQGPASAQKGKTASSSQNIPKIVPRSDSVEASFGSDDSKSLDPDVDGFEIQEGIELGFGSSEYPLIKYCFNNINNIGLAQGKHGDKGNPTAQVLSMFPNLSIDTEPIDDECESAVGSLEELASRDSTVPSTCGFSRMATASIDSIGKTIDLDDEIGPTRAFRDNLYAEENTSRSVRTYFEKKRKKENIETTRNTSTARESLSRNSSISTRNDDSRGNISKDNAASRISLSVDQSMTMRTSENGQDGGDNSGKSLDVNLSIDALTTVGETRDVDDFDENDSNEVEVDENGNPVLTLPSRNKVQFKILCKSYDAGCSLVPVNEYEVVNSKKLQNGPLYISRKVLEPRNSTLSEDLEAGHKRTRREHRSSYVGTEEETGYINHVAPRVLTPRYTICYGGTDEDEQVCEVDLTKSDDTQNAASNDAQQTTSNKTKIKRSNHSQLIISTNSQKTTD